MNITKVEVRTHYSVTFTPEDLYENRASKRYGNPFKEETTLEEIEARFVFNGFTATELSWIADVLGFDGWEWAGLPKNGGYTAKFYKEGDALNGD